MDFEEKTLKVNEIYNGKIINLHVDDIELPDGKRAIREIVEHSGGVCVAAMTEDRQLYFVRQYRYPYKKVLLELPAGKLEKGEDPLKAGIRELEEECGVVADEIISLGTVYPTVAYCSEIIYLYAAKGLKKTNQHLDADEFLSVEKISLDEAVEMVMNNEISDSKTVAIVLKLNNLVKENKF
ncbi:MAG: NUDIX hydrolase [Clostridia bacterium]|nr:NUDIX hydrolase [Clostridia bacterium]